MPNILCTGEEWDCGLLCNIYEYVRDVRDDQGSPAAGFLSSSKAKASVAAKGPWARLEEHYSVVPSQLLR